MKCAPTSRIAVLAVGLFVLATLTGCDLFGGSLLGGYGSALSAWDPYGFATYNPDYSTIPSVLDYQGYVYDNANSAWDSYIRGD